MTSLLADLLSAFRLLTRLPIRWPGAEANLARGIWAFPVVGLTVNALGGAIYWLTHRLGMPPFVAAAWALAATMIVTGALHEDGLADTADGFGGGTSPERKLAIMRDSRIGSYGALALILSALLRWAAIAALNDPCSVMIAFCVAGTLGRGGIIVLVLTLRPARDDGLGAAMGKTDTRSAAAGLILVVVACVLALPILPAVATMIASLATSLAVVAFARGQIGGYTGDVLGAAEVITESVALSVAVCTFSGAI